MVACGSSLGREVLCYIVAAQRRTLCSGVGFSDCLVNEKEDGPAAPGRYIPNINGDFLLGTPLRLALAVANASLLLLTTRGFYSSLSLHPQPPRLELSEQQRSEIRQAFDLFDLDDQFASEKVRLAHLTNKCNDDDLEYFITEAGDLLGVNAGLQPGQRTARHVLAQVFKQISAWKKLNAEPEAMAHFKRLNHMP